MFELNVSAAELLRQGIRLKVQEQPLRVLQYLAEHAGQLVTREELQSHLWPDGTFVDFEHSLNTAIKKLRQTLNDDADNPRFIETVPRRGWRFIAPVDWVGFQVVSPRETAAEAPITQIATVEPASPSWRRGTLITVALIVVVIAAAVWIWFGFRASPTVASAPIEVKPLTTYPGSEADGMISPDGQQVAFAWDQADAGKEKPYHIFVKQIGTESPLQLTSGDDVSDAAPSWSPDGSYIAFARAKLPMDLNDPIGELMIMPALGGSVRTLTTVHIVAKLGSQSGPSMSWSPDGKNIIFSDRTPDGQHFAIFELSMETLQRKQITDPPISMMGDSYPSFSPDGKTIAFVRTTKESADVYSQPASGGSATRVSTENHVVIMGVSWTADGKSLVYGGFGVWEVSAKGGKSQQLFAATMACSPNIRGNRLVYSDIQWEENIWSANLDHIRRRGAKTAVGGKSEKELAATDLAENWHKEFASTRSEEGLRFSPDGSRVAFQSTRTGTFEIWVSNPDGSNPVRLTNYNGPLTGSPRWSPDGQSIAYDSRPNGNSDIFVVSPNGGLPRQLTHDPTDEIMPSFSHDGQRIYFGWDRDGMWNIYSMPASGGTPKQVTKNGGFTAVESPDGKYVYYAKGPAQPGLWRVPVEGGEEAEVIHDLQPSLYGYWVVTKDGIYYAGFDQFTAEFTRSSLRFYSFKTGKSERIATLPLPIFYGAPGMEISPDGKKIYLVMIRNQGADLKLAENIH